MFYSELLSTNSGFLDFIMKIIAGDILVKDNVNSFNLDILKDSMNSMIIVAKLFSPRYT